MRKYYFILLLTWLFVAIKFNKQIEPYAMFWCLGFVIISLLLLLNVTITIDKTKNTKV